jgi:predicted transposase/invertase (TIGR01784 family)
MEGKMEGKMEVAKAAKQMGLSIPDIAKLTGLTEDEINKL